MTENRTRPPTSPLGPAAIANAGYVEAQYAIWKKTPSELDEPWRLFFEGFDIGRQSDCPEAPGPGENQSKVASLIYAYRDQGHRMAHVDPLSEPPADLPELAIEQFGLSPSHLDQAFDTGHLGAPQRATLRDIIDVLRRTYCHTIGVEYIHIQQREIRRWLQAEMEPQRNRPAFSAAKQTEILARLIDAELFETFLHRRYPGQKRFSLEGAESSIAALHTIVELAPDLGVDEMVLGMAHRGRLNVLANILDKPYEMLFSEFEDILSPEWAGGGGDVKYHRGFRSTHINGRDRPLQVTLSANPSHLEAVCPVVEGRARAKQRRLGDTEKRRRVLPVLIHGDAAFAGQGLVAETFNLSQLPGYQTGGTVHLIINNQIGFTTLPTEARSSPYPTEVAKIVEAPIFHVNGDDPEAVVYVSELALRFRQEFGRDVVIDLVCYRRHGHNEGDEPAFTQPLLYQKIRERPSVKNLYRTTLQEAGVLSPTQVEALARSFEQRLQSAFDVVKERRNRPEADTAESAEPTADTSPTESTGVSHADLLKVAQALTTVPPGFNLNPKIARHLPQRLERVAEKQTVDWALAELLAFGSLLQEGTPVRLSGQDSVRGTFSHRHAIWFDTKTGAVHSPLAHIDPEQAAFCAYNSMLSEAGVLGFDYGYSLEEPSMLVIWEAQFGDFANGAQVIIDQFVVAAEAKWQESSGIVLLLPHGYEGQGPEHSNAYLERYLTAGADQNIRVCSLTTPAQLFHALRRQVRGAQRKPLVVLAPKSMLRHPRVVSPVDELTTGQFQPILDDPQGNPSANRVLLCSGKVFFDLQARRELLSDTNTAMVRLEQIYPVDSTGLRQVLARYPKAEKIIWVQEEPKNRGAWFYLAPRLRRLFPDHRLEYTGRKESASPATGSHRIHQLEQEQLLRAALPGPPD